MLSRLEPQDSTKDENLQVEGKQEATLSFDISKFDSIGEAFISLTSNVSKLLENEYFPPIRRSCIEQMKTSSGAQLSPDMIQKIKAANDLNALLDILVDCPYWSWIDLRLLEAMVAASGSSVAKGFVNSYRNAIFSKKLLEVLPSIPNTEVKDAYYSKIVSKLQKDVEQIIVSDLLKFQYHLETVIMDIASGTCALASIIGGCNEIHWLVPTHCIDDAYQSACLKHCKFHEFNLQYLHIGRHMVIHDPSVLHHSRTAPPEISLPDTAGEILASLQHITTYLYAYCTYVYDKTFIGENFVKLCTTLKFNTAI